MTWWQVLLAVLGPSLAAVLVMAACMLREHRHPTRTLH